MPASGITAPIIDSITPLEALVRTRACWAPLPAPAKASRMALMASAVVTSSLTSWLVMSFTVVLFSISGLMQIHDVARSLRTSVAGMCGAQASPDAVELGAGVVEAAIHADIHFVAPQAVRQGFVVGRGHRQRQLALGHFAGHRAGRQPGHAMAFQHHTLQTLGQVGFEAAEHMHRTRAGAELLFDDAAQRRIRRITEKGH